jgi:hypothetical protein
MPALASRGVEVGIILALLLLSLHRSAVVFAAGTTGMAVALVGAAALLFAAGNRIVPVAQPLLILLLGWAGLSVRQAVESARRRAEIEKARQIAEHELDIGRKIQSGFLPADLPVPQGWQIAAHFQAIAQGQKVGQAFGHVQFQQCGPLAGCIPDDPLRRSVQRPDCDRRFPDSLLRFVDRARSISCLSASFRHLSRLNRLEAPHKRRPCE